MIVADIPKAAVDAASGAIGLDKLYARAALEEAAPILADHIASAILRYADENEPAPGSGGYLAWHRHFEAASAVAAKAFGRDNLEPAPSSPVESAEAPVCPKCGTAVCLEDKAVDW